MRNNYKKVWFLLLGLVLAFSLVSTLGVGQIHANIFAKTETPDFYVYLTYSDVSEQYDRSLIRFKSGDNYLQGYLYGAENDKGLVVISHGIGGGAESYLAETLYFVDHGYRVFAYDNTGCHRSEGSSMVGLPQAVRDLDAALSFVESDSRFGKLPILLYGHSWGGYAVSAILQSAHDIAASVSVAGFNRPISMLNQWGHNIMGFLAYLEYPYIWLYQQLSFGSEANLTALDGINATHTPVLILQGSADKSVDYETISIASKANEITNPNAKVHVYDQAPHNDHTRIFMSDDAVEYESQISEEMGKLQSENPEMTEDEWRDYFNSLDKARVSALNEEFFAEILNFYEAALQ